MSFRLFSSEAGFSMVELLVAMAVFSFMLSIIVMGYLQIYRIREAGSIRRNVQQESRQAMDQVVKTIRLSADSFNMAGGVTATSTSSQLDRICLKRAGQSVVLETSPANTSPTSVHKLYLNTYSGVDCDGTVIARQQLTSDAVSVTQLKAVILPADPVQGSQGALSISLSLASAYGLDKLDTSRQQLACLPGSGTQFCIVQTFNSTAVLKGGTE